MKELPKGKNVVLGVVTSKFAELEDVDEMVKRIHEAADRLAEGREWCTREEALKQLSVSPQCGFASHAEVSRESLIEKGNSSEADSMRCLFRSRGTLYSTRI